MLFGEKDKNPRSRIVNYFRFAGLVAIFFLNGFHGSTVPDLQAQTCLSTPIDVGYQNFNFQSGGVTGAPTEEKPQSKLWHNDGFWWGVLWDADRETHRIHRFDLSSRCWSSVGPDLDSRPRSSADALWDGAKLYVASSAKRNHRTQDGDELIRIYRLSYNSSSNTYSEDVGFPVILNDTERTRGVVIAKDSSGKLWATWTADGKVMVNRTVGNDAIWDQAFVLPAQLNDLKIEDDDFTVDLSSIVAFGGDKIGIIWGNQNPDIDHEQRRYFFSVHTESDPDTVWQSREDILPGLSVFDPEEQIADDHLNLACPAGGDIVLAAVKTGVNDAGFPFVCVAKRSVTGTWTYSTYGTPAQAHTRPTMLYDSDTDSVYVFAKSEQDGQEAIYVKSAHLDNLTFSPGLGSRFLHSEIPNNISNPTSTKQCVDATTGILLLASDRTSEHYFHNYFSAGNAAPIALDESAMTNRDTPVSIDVLANDSDADGTLNAATLALVRNPENGSATINSVTGLLLYTPSQGFAGLDTLKYTVRDDDHFSATAATVTIFVNQLPVATDDAITGDEDTPTNIGVAANDNDPDGTLDFSSVVIVEAPRHGSASVDTATGIIIYTPDANFMARDTLSYTIQDNHGATSNTAIVTITVANINDPPFVVSDTTLAHQGVSLEIAVLANDNDIEGAINLGSLGIGSLPSNGTVAVNPGNGTISYLSDAAFFGVDSFTYTVADEEGARSGEALVVVNVNALPVAEADTAVTHRNSLLVFSTVANDSDADGSVEPATLQIVATPANGLAVVDQSTGEITYSPTTDFVGQDGLSYTVRDNDGGASNAASVQIKVNAPPVAHPDSAIAIRGTPLNIHVLGNDTDSDGVLDSTAITISSQALNGTAVVDTTSGMVIYTPNPGFAGNDLFQYTAQDNDGAPSNAATVSVRVNIPPTANDDLITTDEEVAVVIDVTANDNDIDGSLVLSSLALMSGVSNGTLTLNDTTGVFTYSPNLDFFGSDSLRYRLQDNLGAISNTALVVISVNNVNDVPVASSDTAATDEETEVAIDVLANDRDIDSNFDLSSVTVVVSPNHGAASVNPATGQINYLPELNFVGNDTLTYNFSDLQGAVSNAARVYISVGNVNDPPVTLADSSQTDEETPVTVAVLSNDQDVDGSIDASSLNIAGPPSHGTATVDGLNGNIIYTPEPDFVGVDSLAYTVADDDGAASNATLLTVTVTDVNDPPVAADDSVTTDEETLVLIDVLANDRDIDGTIDLSTVVIVTLPANGTTLIDAANGTIGYTPAQNFVGVETFSYRVSDEDAAASNTASVAVVVANLNDHPIAVNDTARTNKDTPFSIQVLVNDYDVDGTVVASTLTLVSAPSNGTVTVDGSSGEIGYTPPAGFTGADTLTYTVNDDVGAVSNLGMAVIIVNEFPVANDDNVLTVEEQPVEIEVLANDFDTDASLDPASIVVANQASQGVAAPDPNAGTIIYAPNPNYFGPDSFTYTVRDEFGAISNVATVNVQVNRPPFAVNDVVNTHEDVPVEIAAAGNDIDLDGAIDASTLQVVSPPNSGAAVVDTVRQTITYTPAQDYSGSDAFSYRVSDSQGAISNVATVTVSVNDAPIATHDSVLTHLEVAIDIDVKENDSDSDGVVDSTSVRVLAAPAFGTATLDSTSGIINYSPDPGFFGVDRFSYTIDDLQGARSDSGSVSVRVNNPPVTAIDSVQTIRMFPVVIDVLGNDSDVDGTIDSTSVSVLAAPQNGATAVDGTDGTITYTPEVAFSGNDSLTYRVADNDEGISVSTTVRIFVAPNATPVALDDSASTDEDSPVVIDVVVNDSDADFDGSIDFTTVSVIGPPANGTTTVNQVNGEITYTPSADFFGTDSLTYTVKDNVGAESDPATVVVLVRGINDAPVAVDDTVRTNEVTTATIAVTTNDHDIDGTLDPASVTLRTLPSNGIASVQPETGAVIYAPARGFSGTDTLTYSVNDNDGVASNTASVLILVNDSPVASRDSVSTFEEQTVRIAVLSNDTDSDGTLDSSSVALVTAPSNGSVASDTLTGELIYTPVLNFAGLDSLGYRVRDDQSATSNTAKVLISVQNLNDPPVAEDDQATTDEEVALAMNVLQNDRDIDSALDSTTVALVQGPINGTASVSDTTGAITYTPAPDFFGVDSLSYSVKDEDGAISNTATVRLLIANVNDPPVALSDSVRTNRGVAVAIDPLANDSDIDGVIDSTSVAVSPGSNGSASASATGLVTYSPDPGFAGVDMITYTVRDDQNGVSNDAIIRVFVNDLPLAVDDTTSTQEESSVTIVVLANDSDSDGTIVTSSVQIRRDPVNGSATVDSISGEITYIPNLNFAGLDTLTYTISDDEGAGSNVAAVRIRVHGVNDLPVANPDTLTTSEDVAASIDVTANDTDLDGIIDISSIVIVNGVANGQATVNDTTGAITYRPNAEFSGRDSLGYRVSDDSGGSSNVARVSIEVLSVNDSPVAYHDTVSTSEDVPVTIDVMANDTDLDGIIDISSLVILNGVANGQATVNDTTGAITYRPNAEFSGRDSLDYRVSDDSGGSSNVARVSIRVLSVNDSPVANPDTLTTREDTAANIDIAANDTDIDGAIDRSSIVIVKGVANGQATTNDTTGIITYEPTDEFFGRDSLDYRVSDDSGAVSNVTRVLIRVTSVNDPPIANNDTTGTNEDTPTSVTVLLNDLDIDGSLDSTSVSLVQGPSHGAVSVNPAGAISYSPGANFVGSDSLSYTVSDDSSTASNTAFVYFQVAGLNDAPVARDDTTSTPEDTEVLIAVLENDQDVDDGLNSSSIQITSDPSHGSAADEGGTGRILYRPIANYEGTDSFSYQVSDSAGEVSNVATVSITVDSVNDMPIARDDSSTVSEDGQVVIDVLSNDRDVDGTIDQTTVSILADPANGVTSVSGTGDVTYIPSANFTGIDGFTYHVADNEATNSNEASVSVVVIGINDAPVANDDTTSTDGNNTVVIAVLSNDVDVDNNMDFGSISIIKEPLIGTTAIDNTTGDVTYTLTPGLLGGDRFTYRISDTDGLVSNIATVIVQVDGDNNAPVGQNDDAMTFQDVPVVIPVTSNDSDSDGALDLSSLTVTSNGSNGNAEVIGETGNIVYTPSTGFLGNDSFTYTIRDNGNLSSNATTVTIVIHPSSLAFTPIHDSHVRSNSPGSNFGNASEHRVRKTDTSTWLTFLKFEVQGIAGQVQRATVRLRTVEASNDGGTIFPVSNNFAGSSFPWTEDLLFYSNAPTDLDGHLNSVGSVGNGQTVEFDVTGAINGDGTYSFGISNQSTDVVQYSSKEGSAAPELVIQLRTTSFGSPSITAFSPASGTAGQDVTISGSDLSLVTEVRFGGVATTSFTVDSSSQIIAQVPEGAVSGKIDVLSPVGNADSPSDFIVPAAPVITSLNPTSGPVSTEVAILGSNFTGASVVSFSGAAAGNFTVDSNTRIRAQIPAGATTGRIEVTTPNGTATSPEAFVVTLGPGIVSFSPEEGIVGTEVTVTGVNLASVSSVAFNSIAPTTFSVESQTQILAIVPVGASSGSIRVTSSEGIATSATTFRVIEPPTITAFSPNSGSIGTEITISGSGFADLTAINFTGAEAAGFTVDSDTQVRAVVPLGAVDGPLSVTNPAGFTASGADFTVVATPTSFSFKTTDDTFIRSSRRTRNYGSDDELRTKEASTTYVTFLKFDVTGLSSAVSRATLRLQTIDGSNDGGSVYAVSNDYGDGSGPWNEGGLVWDNAPPLDTSPLSSIGSIAVGEVAEFDVLAAVSGNGKVSFAIRSSSSDVVKYEPKEGTIAPELIIETGATPVPSITSFSPASGVAGNQVTITGVNFFGLTGVSFNGVAASAFSADSNTKIQATVPVGVSSGPISVTSASGTSVSAQSFTVAGAATITSFLPESGLPGTEVTITGQNLTGTTQVAFNGSVAASFAIDSGTQVRATVPSNATTGTIELSASSGSATSSGDFTVVVPSGGTFTFNPTADAYVRSSRPTQNSGGSAELRVRLSSTDYDSYLKFNITGLSGAVLEAKLRLRVIDDGPDGGAIYLVGNDLSGTDGPWTESNLTFSNAPQFNGQPVNSVGGVSMDQTVEFDVTSAVSGNGIFSFVISSENSNTTKYSSKEGVAAPELVIITAAGSPSAPFITSFSPASGPTGAEVTIAGGNFTGATAVTFNGIAASTFSVASNSEMRATVPAGASSGRIGVSASSGTATSGTDFNVVTLPSILSFNPASGPVGTRVTINGAHLTGTTVVSFSGTPAASFTVDSDSQIRADVPAGASSGTISVENSVGQVVSSNVFTVGTVSTQTLTFQPTDDSFVRSTAPSKNYARDDELRVRLSSTDYNSYLKFNIVGLPGPVQRATVRLLVIDDSPDGGSIFLVSNDFNNIAAPWQEELLVYNNAPEIGSSPLGTAGAVVLNETVEFDVTAAITGNGTFSFALSSEHSNTAKYSSRGGARPPELVIIAGSGTSAPSISSFSPAVGPIGTDVTITGSHFTGATQVTFNGTAAASFAVQSDERILATVPAGASNGHIGVVTSIGTATSTNDFVVFAPPVITSFTPPTGPVGTRVTISGSNFSGVTSVSFNGIAATDFTFVTVNSETKIRATVPSGATTGKISLTNAVGSGSSAEDFNIGNSPIITSFDPTLGVPGTEVTLTGINFSGTTTVSFNDSPAASISIDSDTKLRAKVPAGATTGPLNATNGFGASADSEEFTVVTQPAISNVSPSSGAVGTEVTISGQGLLGTTDVAFNGVSAISFVVKSGTQIHGKVPAGATTGRVIVTNPAGSAISSADFTVATVSDGGTFTFNPSDDAFVRSTRPDNNYENDDELRVRKSSTDYDSYLKFPVSGLTAPVVSAVLRLHVIDDGDQGGEIYSVSNNLRGSATPWTEATITFNNAPEINGGPLDVKSLVALGATVDFDVTAAISGDGAYSFAISNDHSNTVKYSSQEGVTEPELVITTGLTRRSSQNDDEPENHVTPPQDQPLPSEPTLYPNFPNPLNIETTITYALPNAAKVKVRIYNLKGQLVKVLFEGEQERGFQRIVWNGRNRSGTEVSSGVYFLRLEAEGLRLSRKITIQK